MNNRQLKYSILFVLAVFLAACTAQKTETAQTEETETWEGMDEFHMIMAETFHPFKDSAYLEPAKTRAGELVTAAEKWIESPLPEKVNTDEVKNKLQQLKQQASELAELTAVADDSAIGEKLTQLHDTFHELQEAWYNGNGHDHGHGHGHHHH